jgi:predicted ATPase/signal transduction histidine kinase
MKTLLFQSQFSLIYFDKSEEGIDEIWKISADTKASTSDILKNELTKTTSLNYDGFRKAKSLVEYKGKLALILEYVDGFPIEQLVANGTFPTIEFLKIAIECTDLLIELEKAELVHRGINLQNILYETSQNRIKLIDFAEAEYLNECTNQNFKKNSLYNLHFCAPELISKIPQKIDHRADLYSLGVVFYQLLTGLLPHDGKTSADINHAILTQNPTSPRWLNPEIPKQVEDIVIKLISKSPEDRYLSAVGLREDLIYCINNLHDPTLLHLFKVGYKDYINKITVPDTLYGIDTHTSILKNTIETVVKSETVLLKILGKAGCGKTSFSKIVYEQIASNQGIFIYGKYDSSFSGRPFYGILEAFKQLAIQILSENDQKLDEWRKEIQNAVGSIGKVLTDLIPEFKTIIGEQPNVSELSEAETKYRLHYLFQNLTSKIANANRPLAIYLDDFHESDPSSKDLLESIMKFPLSNNILVVCTATPNLLKNGTKFPATGHQITIQLNDLDTTQIGYLLKDVFRKSKIDNLAETIASKTSGTPYFVKQLLYECIEQNCFVLDQSSLIWKANIERIKSLETRQNVLDETIKNIETNEHKCYEVLELLSCTSEFLSLNEIGLILSISEHESPSLVLKLIVNNLINEPETDQYILTNPKLKKNIYEAIDGEKKQLFHSKIGQIYMANFEFGKNRNSIFEIATQLYLGKNKLPDRSNFKYCNIIYKAGTKAAETGAFELANQYYEQAISFSSDKDWSFLNYSTLHQLYFKAAKTAIINNKLEDAKKYAHEITKYGKTKLERLKANEIQLNILVNEHQLAKAVDLLLDTLKELGYPIKRNPSVPKVGIELLKTKIKLINKSKSKILNLPLMTNPEAITFMKLTADYISAVFAAAPDVLPIIIFKQLQLSLKYGNSTYSPSGYTSYGFALATFMNNIDGGFEFGEIALELMLKLNAKENYAKATTIFHGFISYWKKDIRQSIEPLKLAYTQGRENGDLLYAAFASSFHSAILFYSGENLKVVHEKMTNDSLVINDMGQKLVFVVSELQKQLVGNLIDQGDLKSTFIIGDEDTEQNLIDKLVDLKDNATLFDFHVYKLILAYILEDYADAQHHYEEATIHEDETSSRQLCYPYFLFFSALAIAENNSNGIIKKPKKLLKAIKKLETISKICHINFSAKYYLAQAAYLKRIGSYIDAINNCRKAIIIANENNIIQEKAIAYEILAKCYIATHEWDLVELMIQKSWQCYSQWGAVKKTKQLELKYPEFIKTKIYETQFANDLNKDVMFKIVKSLSEEESLESQIASTLKLLSEYFGITYSVVIFNDLNNNLKLKAKTNNEGMAIHKTNSTQLMETDLPMSFINLVSRTKQPISHQFLSPSIEDPFYTDTYFKRKHDLYAACFPIYKNNRLISIFYLENQTTPSTINEEKINEFIATIAPQLATSIENVLLFEKQENIRKLEADYNQNLLIVSNVAEEKERKRIAEELHDDIGALLSTTKLYLSHLQNSEGEQKQRSEEKITVMLDKAITNVRNLSHRLSPMSLERYGLESVLNSYCDELNASGKIKVNYNINVENRMPFQNELQIYRISQELFNNTIKYSQASEVDLEIKTTHNYLYFKYSDNGIGFDMDSIKASKNSGIGTSNIVNRAKLISAQYQMESKKGEGVKVFLELNNYFLSKV